MSEAKILPAGPRGWKPDDGGNYSGAEDMARAEFWADHVYSLPHYKTLSEEEMEEAFILFAAQRAWRREQDRRIYLGFPEIPYDPAAWRGRY